MLQSSQTHFLCLHFSKSQPDTRYSLRIASDAPEKIVEDWEAETRISPVWPLLKDKSSNVKIPSGSTSDVIFINNTDPSWLYEQLDEEITDSLLDGRLWLSLGTFNIVIFSHSAETTDVVRSLVKSKDKIAEVWQVESSAEQLFQISGFEYVSTDEIHEAPIKSASSFSKIKIPDDEALKFTVLEFYTLLSTIEARSKRSLPVLAKDCFAIENEISRFLDPKDELFDEIIARDAFLETNAGLSRIVSQALSGASPLIRNECHIWPHSFLGLGTANLAVRNVSNFISENTEQARYDEKLQALFGTPFKASEEDIDAEGAYADYPEMNFTREAIYRSNGHDGVQLEDRTDLSPLDTANPITYFSRREGFRAGLFATTVPMMCVPGCNSIQWNLGTITHELSHRIISGTLDNLYRRAFARIESEDSDIHTLAGYFEVPCVTMEDVCEKLLAMTLTTMHIEDFTEEQYKSESNDPLLLLKQAWTGYSREIEEIAVHIFDYYHFYSMQAPQYVESVWRSWAVQPSIRSKLQHYVMRSVTALSIQYFSKPDWKQQAIDEFTMLMNSPKLRKIPFSKEVFEILELEKGDHEIAHYLTKMRHLITVFHFVLKSPELSLLCNGDPYLGKTKGGRSVYSAKERMFGGASADNLRPEFKNPLLFLKSYSQAAKPDAGASAWLFHMLAFNIHEEGTEKLA